MAQNKIRGSQIHDGTITDLNVASNAAIQESKLAIDWSTRTQQILASKLVVDYVQVSKQAVLSGSNKVTTNAISAEKADTNEKKGPIVQDGKNKVIIRDSSTGEPIISGFDTEVYGKLINTVGTYDIEFYTKDKTGVESAYTFPSGVSIDFQYPQRFDLYTVSEAFAMNEKFVDGTADVSTRLDMNQIILDAFGASYVLDQSGDAIRPKSIVQELQDETSGVINTDVRAKTIIDEVVTARSTHATLNARLDSMAQIASDSQTSLSDLEGEITTARGAYLTLGPRLDDMDLKNAEQDQKIEDIELKNTTQDTRLTNAETNLADFKTELKSTDAGKGGSLVGVSNRIAFPTELTVEDALVSLESRVEVNEGNRQEVNDARTSVVYGSFQSLKERVDNGDLKTKDVSDEVVNARTSTIKVQTFTNLDNRLEDIESKHQTFVDAQQDIEADQETRIASLESNNAEIADVVAKKHKHYAEDVRVLSGSPLINTSRYDLTAGTFIPGDKSLQVYFNGMLQMATVHYTENKDVNNNGVAITLVGGTFQQNDVLQLRWHK